MEDTHKTKGMRRKLVTAIKQKGFADFAVLEAIEKVPRHFFLDKAFLAQAYTDQAFQIGAGQTISQPFTVAYQTSLLSLKGGEKVLEIGTGSGYQTCVLMEMGAKVFSIERQKELFDKAKKLLEAMRTYKRAKLFHGDGYKGLPAFAPFDRVLVTCGAPSVPKDLLEQLKVGGTMVIPIGAGKVQIMTVVNKISDKDYHFTEFKEFRFVPMLEKKDWGEVGGN